MRVIEVEEKGALFSKQETGPGPFNRDLKSMNHLYIQHGVLFFQNGDLVHRKEYQHWIQQENMDVSDIVQNWPCLRGKINGLGIP